MKELKYCSGCDKELPIDCFGKDKSKTDELSSRCKKCNNAATKLRRENNSDHEKKSL